MDRIPVKYPGGYSEALKKLDDKNALFQIECDGKTMRLRGVLCVLPDPSSESVFVWIFHKGGIAAYEPPNTVGYDIHLSQSHLDSLIPGICQEKGDHWEVQRPFESRHCIPNSKTHQNEP